MNNNKFYGVLYKNMFLLLLCLLIGTSPIMFNKLYISPYTTLIFIEILLIFLDDIKNGTMINLITNIGLLIAGLFVFIYSINYDDKIIMTIFLMLIVVHTGAIINLYYILKNRKNGEN